MKRLLCLILGLVMHEVAVATYADDDWSPHGPPHGELQPSQGAERFHQLEGQGLPHVRFWVLDPARAGMEDPWSEVTDKEMCAQFAMFAKIRTVFSADGKEQCREISQYTNHPRPRLIAPVRYECYQSP
jgi:hypothetical protein